MTYYDEVRKTNIFLDKVFEQIKSGVEVNVNNLIYEVTTLYSVGPLTVKKRINLLLEVNNEVKMKEGVLFCS